MSEVRHGESVGSADLMYGGGKQDCGDRSADCGELNTIKSCGLTIRESQFDAAAVLARGVDSGFA
jgi:hypothetical protein